MKTKTFHSGVLALFSVFFLILLSPRALPDERLDVTRGGCTEVYSYGGMGYAVRYSVPDPSKSWWCVSVNIYGESYGSAGKNFFTISFMDMDGRVYARSEHPMTFFSATPEWKIVRITPTQLPSEFWVIVDFKSTKEQGVYIGYANTGGQSSMVTDANCGLHPITKESGDGWPIDWGIALRIRDKFKGKQVVYDPAAEPLNKVPEAEEKKDAAQTQDSDHLSVTYTKIDDMWGVSVLRLLETAREGMVRNYGLSFPDKISVTGGLNTGAVTAVRTVGESSLDWNVQARNELLPVVRGGTYPHIFSFCRELARIGIRDTFSDERFSPDGMEEGLAVYLAGEAVRYVEMRCGQKLWPIRYSYIREEGPDHAREWIEGDPADPARLYAAMFYGIDGIIEREKHGEILKNILGEGVPVREFVKRLAGDVSALDKVEIPEGLFPVGFVDPAFLWLFPRPDFESLEFFKGLKAKRTKSNVLLSYDDNSFETTVALSEGFTIAFHTPPGEWKLSSLRMYAFREKSADKTDVPRGGMTFSIQDKEFKEVGSLTADAAALRVGKPGWTDLGGLDEPPLSGPFLVFVKVDETCRGKVRIGCDERGGGGHSFKLVPGSHGEPPGGGFDWMFRVFLTSTTGQDRKALDGIVREFRKAIPK
jgi:hypothetical protein